MHDNQDKDMVRNQLIAFVLLSLLVVVWMVYFMPPPQAPPPEQQAERQQAPVVEMGPSKHELPGASDYVPKTLPSRDASGWESLPPAATDYNPALDDVVISNGSLRLTITRIGARLKEAEVLLGNNGQNTIQLVPDQQGPITEEPYPFELVFTEPGLRGKLNARRFEVVEQSNSRVTLALTIPGAVRIKKTFSLSDKPYVLDADVTCENIEDEPRQWGMDFTPAYYIQWGPQINSQDEEKGIAQSLIWRKEGANDSIATASMTPGDDGTPYTSQVTSPSWVAVRSAYFVVAMRPGFEDGQMLAHGGPDHFFFGLGPSPFEVQPGGEHSTQFEVYIGPSQLQSLKAAWPTLSSVLRFFEWPDAMDWFAKTLLSMLHWLHDTLNTNYGVAIILLTAMVRIIMFPLTLPQIKSAKKMQLLQPEIEKLREEYKDEPQEMQKAMMALWQERGVNPFGGCLPLLLQFPVFIALYRMLWSAYELRGAEFLWIQDLSEPDRLFHMEFMTLIPVVGEFFEYFNVLPLLACVAMVLSMRLTPTGPSTNPQQKMLMTFMPIVFSLLFYNWASGLNLYVLTSTMIGIGQSALTRTINFDVDIEAKKRKPRKRQHFYTAALAKKRRLERESKQAASKANGQKAAKNPKAKGSGKSRTRKNSPKNPK